MTTQTWAAVAQVLVLVALLAAVHVPLGGYMARVYTSPQHLRVEQAWYRAVRVDPDAEQRWNVYLLSVLGFSLVSVLLLYALGRLQAYLPWSLGFTGLDPAGAWNTAVSFTTNTNWQWYSGEAATGHLLQMAGFAVQNFVSASVGMAVAIALVRGFARSGTDARIGNFWTDLTRGVTRILLPLSFVAALVLGESGVIQNLDPHTTATTVEGGTQHVLGGPVASQEAIKELGTNGGGFFNANSAHPFENPTAFTNLVEILALLAIPFALTYAFGRLARDQKQGWAVFAAMFVLWIGSVFVATGFVVISCGVPDGVLLAMERRVRG